MTDEKLDDSLWHAANNTGIDKGTIASVKPQAQASQ